MDGLCPPYNVRVHQDPKKWVWMEEGGLVRRGVANTGDERPSGSGRRDGMEP